MGQIVKQVSENRTRYVWYPGEKREWIRAAWALALGAAAFGALALFVHDTLLAVTVGTTLTAVVGGFNLGRRDFRTTRDFPDQTGKGARRAAAGHAGRAVWRGLVQGVGGATAALLVANLAARGFLADWVLPAVPAVAGALAHQAGMLYERLGREAKPAELPPVPGTAEADTVPVPGATPRTREWVGSYGDSATTVADTQSPKTPTSTGRPTSTSDGT
jgi:hypothetical protein